MFECMPHTLLPFSADNVLKVHALMSKYLCPFFLFVIAPFSLLSFWALSELGTSFSFLSSGTPMRVAGRMASRY